MKHLEDESRESNIDSSQGTQRLTVKTEEKDEPIARGRSFWLGEGATGADPRVHMMYRETELSEGSSDSGSDSSSDVLGELARDFPVIAAEIEEDRKEEERKRVEKRLRRRKVPGHLTFRLVWNRGREVNKKKKSIVEKQEIELKTEGDVKKEEARWVIYFVRVGTKPSAMIISIFFTWPRDNPKLKSIFFKKKQGSAQWKAGEGAVLSIKSSSWPERRTDYVRGGLAGVCLILEGRMDRMVIWRVKKFAY